MSGIKDIPVVTEGAAPRSGEKYRTPQGFTPSRTVSRRLPVCRPPSSAASRPGCGLPCRPVAASTAVKHGDGTSARHRLRRSQVPEHRRVLERRHRDDHAHRRRLHARLPLLRGDTGNPHGWLDAEEPANSAAPCSSGAQLRRADLGQPRRPARRRRRPLRRSVRAIKRLQSGAAVEALTPDFQGETADVETVSTADSTCSRTTSRPCGACTHPVRDPRAGYEQTLDRAGARQARSPRRADQDQPDARPRRDRRRDRRRPARPARGRRRHPHARPVPARRRRITCAVERFVTPAEFDEYRELGAGAGFLECVAGPLVRSSYRAERALERNNAGLTTCRRQPLMKRVASPSRAHVEFTVAASTDVSSPSSMSPVLRWLGRVDYEPTWRAMQRFTDERDADTPDEIWFLEHPPVFTLGMAGKPEHLLAPGRHSGRADRSRRAGHVSRAGPARGLSIAGPGPAQARRTRLVKASNARSSRPSRSGESAPRAGAMHPASM